MKLGFATALLTLAATALGAPLAPRQSEGDGTCTVGNYFCTVGTAFGPAWSVPGVPLHSSDCPLHAIGPCR
ncbi:hypothetical protein B0T24DRAFT_607179 [Lasiosphaeria ovina]|uniref:Uncharacterized protein n=1 Tax=Lasiosphaeria ovina TaxID=92902 RepID=A0AAE0TYC3_9PEZI|nr:hypothetical protein B0T24DRAFT_607179 [Lasiosphaeria ovina]